MENTVGSIQRDTGAWRMQVWISFGIAVLVCGTGRVHNFCYDVCTL